MAYRSNHFDRSLPFRNFFDDLSDSDGYGCCCDECGEEEDPDILEYNDGLCEACGGGRPVIQCCGITQKGHRCRITSDDVHSYQHRFAHAAEPLADGEQYCRFHEDQQYDRDSRSAEDESCHCEVCEEDFRPEEMDEEEDGMCGDCAEDARIKEEEAAAARAAVKAAADKAAAAATAAALAKALAPPPPRASKSEGKKPVAAARAGEDAELVVTGSRTWAERDAEARTKAVDLTADEGRPASRRSKATGGAGSSAAGASTSKPAARQAKVKKENADVQQSGSNSDRKRKMDPAAEVQEQPRRSARARASRP